MTASRPPEQVKKSDLRRLRFRNYQSPRPKTTGPTFNPYAGRKRVREGDRVTKPKRIRTASRKSERRARLQFVPQKSISGRRKLYKPKSPYPGREQRPSERYTDRDIAGRKHRTKNYESPRPRWGGPISRPDTYYGRKPRGEKAGKLPVQGYQPSVENFRATGFQGRFRREQISPGFSEQGVVSYRGTRKARKPLKGGGSISGKMWNNNKRAIAVKPPSRQTQMATQFQGRFRPFELKPGYGDQEKIAKYQGRFRPFELRPGYGEQQNIGRYKGNIRSRKPLKGGGSISGKFWNNDSRPIAVREPGSDTRVASNFRGTLKFRKPLKGGGGSISGRMWNNDKQPLQRPGTSKTSLAAMQFEGRYRTKELNPSLFNDKKAAQYQGELVGDNFFETYQKRRVAIKAARYEGTLKAAVAKKPQQSEGTEIGIPR